MELKPGICTIFLIRATRDKRDMSEPDPTWKESKYKLLLSNTPSNPICLNY